MHTRLHTLLPTSLALATALLALSLPLTANAQQAPADQALSVFHVPPSAADAGEAVTLRAIVAQDWKAASLAVWVRPLGSDDPYTAVPLLRAPDGNFAAIVEGRTLQPPGIEYYVASVDPEGASHLHFASPEAPHPILTAGETEESEQAARLARHHGHRSSFEARGQYTLYGRKLVYTPDFRKTETEAWSDRYWSGEFEYTYRSLGVLYDIFFGIGVMRGNFATVVFDGQTLPADGTRADDPGLNYGYGGVTLELFQNLSFAAHLTLGASARGFAAGAGALVRIGRIAGTRLEVGGELLQDAGDKGFLRFAWDTVPRVPMALTMEIDGWPDSTANPSGTRLFYEAGVELTSQLTLAGQVGRVTREDAVDSGWMGGVTTRWEF